MGETAKQQRWKEVLETKARDAALGRAIKKVSLRKGPGEQQKK
jgi:hypothetical protein